MADVWMKAKQTFLREYKINVDVNKENEQAISKEKELHDVAKESKGKVQEDEVEKIPTFHLLSNSQDLVSPNACHSDEIGKLFHECVEKQMEQEIIENSDENIEALHVEEELRLTSNICRSLSLIDHPFLLRYSQYVSTAFLSNEEIKYVNFLFTRLPKNKTRFVNICGQIATSCQLQSLIGDEFVDRSVYHAWTALMNNIEGMCERKKIFLCPFQVESGVINIDSWMRNIKIKGQGTYEMIIIHVIDCNIHYIIVFDIQKKLIFVNNMMNFAAGSYDSILQKWKETLFSKLSEEGFEQTAQEVMSSRRVNTKGNIRLSLKGKSKCVDVEDCSVFAMRCMQYFDYPLMFESLGKRDYLKLHRIKIAAELLLSEQNLLKKKFLTYARDEVYF